MVCVSALLEAFLANASPKNICMELLISATFAASWGSKSTILILQMIKLIRNSSRLSCPVGVVSWKITSESSKQNQATSCSPLKILEEVPDSPGSFSPSHSGTWQSNQNGFPLKEDTVSDSVTDSCLQRHVPATACEVGWG